jgi:hypothetical protein
MRALSLLLLVIASTAVAGGRIVDGLTTDWTGTPASGAHAATSSADEWILTGVVGDRRTDPGMTDDSDLVELRLTTDGTSLFGLIRMANIAAIAAPHVAIGIDTLQPGGQAFLGDDGNLGVRDGIRPKRQLALHANTAGVPVVEWFDQTNWYGIAAAQIAVSPANDVIEFRVPLTDLNGLTDTSSFVITLATFNNTSIWNNDGDATQTDAVDALGVPGQGAVNAWNRELSNGQIDVGWRVTLRGAPLAPTGVPAGECQSGTWSGTGSAPCTACAPNTFSTNGAVVCLPCPAGMGADAGAAGCEFCRVGSAGATAGGGCQDCTAGSFAGVTGSTLCTQCGAGSFSGAGASACQQCGFGAYSSAPGASSCTACAPGNYNAVLGSVACQQCTAGNFAADAGSSNCTACQAGRYSQAGAATCAICDAGTFSTSGSSSCLNCPPGTSSDAGAGSCAPCRTGTYAATAGAPTCTSCAAGTFGDVAGAVSCTLCPAGQFSDAGATACTLCPGGRFAAAPGQPTCALCAGGTFSGAGAIACTQCGAGTFSDAGSTTCTNCAAGSLDRKSTRLNSSHNPASRMPSSA